MKTYKMQKKGFAIGQLLPIALAFVVTGIAVSFGLSVLSDVKSGFSSSTSYEANATQKTIEAVAKFPAKLGLIATVVIAAVLIGVLVRYLGGAR